MLVSTTGAALVAGLVFMLVGAFATVSPSVFEGNDGNMVLPANSTNKDWVSFTPPALGVFNDSTSNTDDSLGKGSKEDDLVPNVVSQSVPPKDDFKNVFLVTEHVGTSDFLYQSSIRVAPNGSANLNVELNKGTDGLNSNGPPATPKRVAGDRLITFDFTSGGTVATITTLTWATATSDPGATCADSNSSLPCWIDQTVLDPSEAEGAANDGLQGRTGAISSTGNTLTGEALAENRFQEMAINLTAAGILPAGICETFATTTIKSRASGSQGTFNSALKDLVIANKPISNCGSVKIHKQDDAGNALAGVHFDLYADNAPQGGSPPHGAEDTKTSFGCTTNASGDCTISNVPLGKYWAVEDPTTVPAGHTAAADQYVNLTTGGQQVSLTFVNPRQPGSIDIVKVDDTPESAGGPKPLAGAVFTLYTDNAPLDGSPPHGAEDTATAKTCTTDAAGTCSITDVPLGQYWVVETTTPAGHSTAPDQNVILDQGGENVDLTFTDPRQHRVIVIVCHQGTDTLYSSNVTVGSTTRASIGAVPSTLANKTVTEADLCANAPGRLGDESASASFGGFGHQTVTPSVNIAGH